MDVDAMTLDERTRLMKEGKCFRCKRAGHLAKDCPNDDENKKEEPKKKMNGKQLYAHIRSLYKEMTNEDQDEFMKSAEETGF